MAHGRSIFRASLLALMAFVLASLLLACEGETGTTPTPGQGAATRTLTDFLGRRVEVPGQVSRVAALSPTTIELLYAVGGRAVARTDGSTYPPEVTSLPSVGPSYSPSLDLIAAQRPDLLLADSVLQRGLVQQLETLRVPLVMVGAETVADVPRALRLVGEAVGRRQEGEEAAARLERELEAARGRLAARGLKVVVLIADAQNNLYAARSNAYVGSVLEWLGATNPAASLPQTGPFPGFSQVTPEAVTALAPDVILTITPAPPPAPRLSQLLPRLPGMANLPPVQAGRVAELDPVLFLQAPGPRVTEAVAQMSQILEGMR
ncbi:MAG TPA: ABC transporter substrate-binding protein [Dehalococcoidia bacterium]|nr:ABC transporter substrate-binding protein [Dehalococcoidia bacterium]